MTVHTPHTLPQTHAHMRNPHPHTPTYLPEELQPPKEAVVPVRPMHHQGVYAQRVVDVDGKRHQLLTAQGGQVNLSAGDTVNTQALRGGAVREQQQEAILGSIARVCTSAHKNTPVPLPRPSLQWLPAAATATISSPGGQRSLTVCSSAVASTYSQKAGSRLSAPYRTLLPSLLR